MEQLLEGMELIRQDADWFETPWDLEFCVYILVNDNGIVRKFKTPNRWAHKGLDDGLIDWRKAPLSNRLFWREVYDKDTHYKTHREGFMAWEEKNDRECVYEDNTPDYLQKERRWW